MRSTIGSEQDLFIETVDPENPDNYLTPEGVAFYDRSVTLYERLASELNFNVMFSQRGHMTLAHTDASLRTMRWRAEVNKVQGVDSEVIEPVEVKRLAPPLDVSDAPRYPILGALFHPPGGIIRHDAVVWGYTGGVKAPPGTYTARLAAGGETAERSFRLLPDP